MGSTPTIGVVEQCDLELRQNATTAFSVEWWADEDHTSPIPITAARGQVRESEMEDAPLVLDFTEFINTGGNVAEVVIPPEALASLRPMTGGFWDLILETDTGEDRAVLEGYATIKRGATHA